MGIDYSIFHSKLLTPPLLQEVQTDLYHWLSSMGKAIGILAVVDLLQSLICTLIKLHFHHIDCFPCLHHHIKPTLGGVRLHNDAIIAEQGENDVEHLLVMTLVMGIVAIRHGLRESPFSNCKAPSMLPGRICTDIRAMAVLPLVV